MLAAVQGMAAGIGGAISVQVAVVVAGCRVVCVCVLEGALCVGALSASAVQVRRSEAAQRQVFKRRKAGGKAQCCVVEWWSRVRFVCGRMRSISVCRRSSSFRVCDAMARASHAVQQDARCDDDDIEHSLGLLPGQAVCTHRRGCLVDNGLVDKPLLRPHTCLDLRSGARQDSVATLAMATA